MIGSISLGIATNIPSGSTGGGGGGGGVITPPVGIGSNHFYTQGELDLWRYRLENNIWMQPMQNVTNSPARGFEIIAWKNHFMAGRTVLYNGPVSNNRQPTNSVGVWDGSNPVPCWANDVDFYFTDKTRGNGSRPDGKGDPTTKDFFLNACFYARVFNDANVVNKCVNWLISQVRVPNMDFSNRSRWVVNIASQLPGAGNVSYGWQTNPFFFLGDWIGQIATCYDYIKDYMSPTQQAEAETWLYNAGDYFMQNIEDNLANLYNNETDRDNNVPKSSMTTPFLYGGKTHQYYSGSTLVQGYHPSIISATYNNRVLSQLVGIAKCGLVTNNTTLKEYAKKVWKEFIVYAVYPDSTLAEQHRTKETAMRYGGAIMYSMVEIADNFYKYDGDNSLFNYSTTSGMTGTGGAGTTTDGSTVKDLKLLIQGYAYNFKTPATGWGTQRYSAGYKFGDPVPFTDGLRYFQHHLVPAIIAYHYYEEQWLWDFFTMNTSAGYVRGWQPENNLMFMAYHRSIKGMQQIYPDGAVMYFPDPSEL